MPGRGASLAGRVVDLASDVAGPPPTLAPPLAAGLRLENDLATLLGATENRVEGARAFLEERRPRWSGR